MADGSERVWTITNEWPDIEKVDGPAAPESLHIKVIPLSEAEAKVESVEAMYEGAVNQAMARAAERDEARADAINQRVRAQKAERHASTLQGALERIRALDDEPTKPWLKLLAEAVEIAREALASTPQPSEGGEGWSEINLDTGDKVDAE